LGQRRLGNSSRFTYSFAGDISLVGILPHIERLIFISSKDVLQ
jgi:ABC-type Fe3+-siderophore transport system permease subunit